MSFELDIPADYLQDLFTFEFEDVAKEMLDAVAPELEQATKDALKAVIQHPGDSDLVNSVKTSKPKVTTTDAVILNANPKGYSSHTFSRTSGAHTHRYPVSNALKAIWLQYGVAGRQAPRPWLHMIEKINGTVMEKMQSVWEQKVGADK